MSETRSDLFVAVNFVRRCLLLAGHWPSPKNSITSQIKSSISLLSAILFFSTNFIEIIVHFDDFKNLAENMSVTAPVFAFVVKLLFFKKNQLHFFKMMDFMGTLRTSRGKYENYVENMSRKCILIMKIYGGICSIVVTLYAILSLASDTILPIKFSYNFGNWIYGMYIFQMTAIMNTAFHTVCLDMLAICFMGTAIAQLEILGDNIGEFPKNNKEQRFHLKECIIHHTDIIRFISAVEDVFTIFFLTQYLSSIFSICNIGFQLANIHPMSAQFANMVFYFSAMMWQLATFCWFGNEIVVKSLAVSDNLYEVNWLESSSEIKKSLIIIMTRANRGLAVTAGKFSPLSLKSLTSIMNASYSYFALMNRLYNKN